MTSLVFSLLPSVAVCCSIVVATEILQSNLRAVRIRNGSVLYFDVHFQTVCVFESASFACSINKWGLCMRARYLE